MKSTLFTFLMFIGITVFSQAGNVVFFTEDGELFFVSMNGVKINTSPMANVAVPGVKAPGAMATITFADASLGVVKKNVMAADGREYTYKVKKNKKGAWKVYPFTDVAMGTTPTNTIVTASDPVLIQQKADPIVEEKPVKEEKIQTTTVTVPVTTTTTVSSNNNVQSNANPAVNGISLNINMNGVQGNQQQTATNTAVQNGTATSTTTTTTTNTTNTVNTTQQNTVQPNNTGVSLSLNINTNGLNTALNGVNNAVNTNVTTSTTDVTTSNDVVVTDNSTQTIQTTTPVNDVVVTSSNSGCSMAMDASEFSAAKSSISSKSFEDSRMKVAKQITENNCLSTTQVKEIMGLFSFEGSKLDFAKFAYAYTYDKNNYYKVNDALGFESSIEELQTYIKANK